MTSAPEGEAASIENLREFLDAVAGSQVCTSFPGVRGGVLG
jgi:hypothetical protein